MRITIHLVAKRDFWPFALATRAARRALWLRSMRGGTDEAQMTELAARVREHLTQTGEPISRKQLDALVGKPHAIGIGQWIDLVRVPPAGTWERRRADLFAAAEDWVGPPPQLDAADAAAAARAPLPRRLRPRIASRRRLLHGPGAARPRAGARRHAAAPLSRRVRRRAARCAPRAAARPRPARPGPLSADVGLDAARPRPPRADPARGAPAEDLPRAQPALRPDVPRRRRGRRHVEARDGAIELEPFGRIDAATRRELRAEADRLAAFHA